MNIVVFNIGIILIASAVGAAIFLFLLTRHNRFMDDLQVASWEGNFHERIWDPNDRRHGW